MNLSLSPWVKWRTEENLSHLLHVWHIENVAESADVKKGASYNDFAFVLELDLVLDFARIILSICIPSESLGVSFESALKVSQSREIWI